MNNVKYECKCGGSINSESFLCYSCGRDFFLGAIDKPVFLEEDEYSVIGLSDVEEESQTLVERSRPSIFRQKLKKIFLGQNTSFSKHLERLNLGEKSGLGILVIGGGSVGQGLEELYENYRGSIVSVDIYNSNNVDCIMDAHELFFSSDQFDLVIIQAVLEHVFLPEKVVSEIFRVLKNNGFVYAEVPFIQNVHEGAYDFTRYTRGGLIKLFRSFHAVEVGPVKGPGHALGWSFRAILQPMFPKFVATALAAPIFWTGRLIDAFLQDEQEADSSACYYYLGQKLKKHLPYTARQIVSMYR